MSEVHVLKLDRNSGIACAEELGHKLESAFQAGTPVKIDASEVERVDTTTVQLIYSFLSSMNDLGVDVSFDQPSESFLSGSERLGFLELFKLQRSI